METWSPVEQMRTLIVLSDPEPVRLVAEIRQRAERRLVQLLAERESDKVRALKLLPEKVARPWQIAPKCPGLEDCRGEVYRMRKIFRQTP